MNYKILLWTVLLFLVLYTWFYVYVIYEKSKQIHNILEKWREMGYFVKTDKNNTYKGDFYLTLGPTENQASHIHVFPNVSPLFIYYTVKKKNYNSYMQNLEQGLSTKDSISQLKESYNNFHPPS